LVELLEISKRKFNQHSFSSINESCSNTGHLKSVLIIKKSDLEIPSLKIRFEIEIDQPIYMLAYKDFNQNTETNHFCFFCSLIYTVKKIKSLMSILLAEILCYWQKSLCCWRKSCSLVYKSFC